jgi:hypothetical protein
LFAALRVVLIRLCRGPWYSQGTASSWCTTSWSCNILVLRTIFFPCPLLSDAVRWIGTSGVPGSGVNIFFDMNDDKSLQLRDLRNSVFRGISYTCTPPKNQQNSKHKREAFNPEGGGFRVISVAGIAKPQNRQATRNGEWRSV